MALAGPRHEAGQAGYECDHFEDAANKWTRHEDTQRPKMHEDPKSCNENLVLSVTTKFDFKVNDREGLSSRDLGEVKVPICQGVNCLGL